MITFEGLGYFGRFGNQMFQYASGLGISIQNHQKFGFPSENSEIIRTGVLGYDEKCVLDECFNLTCSRYEGTKGFRTGVDTSSEFNHEWFDIGENINIHGYFQDEKYFKHCENLIRSEFEFNDSIKETATAELNKLKNSSNEPLISVHVRRGDYLQLSDVHPPCSLEYYNEAFDISSVLNEGRFLVFSDDISWCKENFKLDNIIFSEVNDSYTEMCMMTMCDHHIIANSSFSWWGAWLGHNKSKTVIAPQRWFADRTTTIQCEEWNLI
tara:strand:+ start:610 stop:1413 length:804 start_codon:yes stop_codon:yes gene_type:complete